MSTARDICTKAVRRLIPAIGQDLSADEATVVLDALNKMMSSWAAKGVDVNHYPLDLESPFPLEEMHEQGVIALLAMRIAGDFGITDAALPSGVVRDADEGWTGLQAAYIRPGKVRFDGGLARMPSQRLLEG